jgi:hypothetical protein
MLNQYHVVPEVDPKFQYGPEALKASRVIPLASRRGFLDGFLMDFAFAPGRHGRSSLCEPARRNTDRKTGRLSRRKSAMVLKKRASSSKQSAGASGRRKGRKNGQSSAVTNRAVN